MLTTTNEAIGKIVCPIDVDVCAVAEHRFSFNHQVSWKEFGKIYPAHLRVACTDGLLYFLVIAHSLRVFFILEDGRREYVG